MTAQTPSNTRVQNIVLNFSPVSISYYYMRWVGHVGRIGEMRGAYRVLVGKPEGKRQLGRHSHRWKIILRWSFRKRDGGHGLARSGSGKGQVAGTCECGNKPSGFIKFVEFPDYLRSG